MGQQQILLIIAGVIVVGIAIAVGIQQFGANSAASNKDGITSSLTSLSADAYQYKLRPSTLGGGNNSYVGFTVPSKLVSDDNGTYAIGGSPSATSLQIVGTSSVNSAWVATIMLDSTGLSNVVYTGW